MRRREGGEGRKGFLPSKQVCVPNSCQKSWTGRESEDMGENNLTVTSNLRYSNSYLAHKQNTHTKLIIIVNVSHIIQIDGGC